MHSISLAIWLNATISLQLLCCGSKSYTRERGRAGVLILVAFGSVFKFS